MERNTSIAAGEAHPFGRRIAVVGVTCSGKSTLAARLSGLYGIRHISMDALHWEAGWQSPPPQVFRQRVDAATSAPGWVTDGNYKEVRDLVWERAEGLVWLDYPLGLVLWRLTQRTLKRILTREELWNGNRETWRGAFLSADSLFLYLLQSHPRIRRTYPEALALPVYRHLKVARLSSPRQLEQWFCSLGGFDRQSQVPRQNVPK